MEARRLLGAVDWTFAGPFRSGTVGTWGFDARRHHPYPATFPPALAFTLIELFSKAGGTVLDPFSGIGTTAFQAGVLGRRPIGGDICRVSLESARRMWSAIQTPITPERLDDVISQLHSGYNASRKYEQSLALKKAIVEELSRWYAPETFRQLSYIYGRLAERIAGWETDIGQVSFLATAKAVSAQDRGWGCIADNMRPTATQRSQPKDALARFTRAARALVRDVADIQRRLPPSVAQLMAQQCPNDVFIDCDVRESAPSPPESVDLILTSPPYPNMTDYATSQRLPYYWLDLLPEEDLAREIGARRRRFRATSLDQYETDMSRAWANVLTCLRPRGLLCIVLPEFSRTTENNVARRQLIRRMVHKLEDRGLRKEGEVERQLPTRRRHHNQNWASLSKERIHIFSAAA